METRLVHSSEKIQLWVMSVVIAFITGSCTVTNNLYVNDPFPLIKSDYEMYGGIGMGLKPKIDSVSASGEVYSKNFLGSYSLNFGARYGVTNLLDVGLALHLPEIVGGAGASLRPKFCMFPYPAKFNLALAADIGFVIAEDSLRILGSSTALDDETRGAFNTDFSFPIGYRIGKNMKLILTPRYSFNTFYLRKSYDNERSKRLHVQYPALSIGFRMNKVQFETTVIKFRDVYKYMAGVVIFFGK